MTKNSVSAFTTALLFAEIMDSTVEIDTWYSRQPEYVVYYKWRKFVFVDSHDTVRMDIIYSGVQDRGFDMNLDKSLFDFPNPKVQIPDMRTKFYDIMKTCTIDISPILNKLNDKNDKANKEI